MIGSEAVEVMRFDGASWESETVMGVLPGTPTTEGGMSGAASTSVEFHFPRGYGESLAGAWLKWRGRMFQVMGDPQPYLEANVPGRWTMPAKATAREYPEELALLAPSAARDEFGDVSAEWREAWKGRCRIVGAEEARQTMPAAEFDESEAQVAVMPDAVLLGLGAASVSARLRGAAFEVASVAQSAGIGSEVVVALRRPGLRERSDV